MGKIKKQNQNKSATAKQKKRKGNVSWPEILSREMNLEETPGANTSQGRLLWRQELHKTFTFGDREERSGWEVA